MCGMELACVRDELEGGIGKLLFSRCQHSLAGAKVGLGVSAGMVRNIEGG